jgi:GTP cyclohydrolase FolE2
VVASCDRSDEIALQEVHMPEERKFLVDVGIRGVPFPIRVASRTSPDGQPTVANISITARIMREFEARWIDTFIQILHRHRDRIGTKYLGTNILDYYKELNAAVITIDFDCPFFIEKTTPVSKEKCLVRYLCTFSAEARSDRAEPSAILKIEVPVITTYPLSATDKPGGLFGQLSTVKLEVGASSDVFPEDLVEIVDRHALAPTYSFLTEEDQVHIIEKVHSQRKTSVAMVDAIREELARNKSILRYSVLCSNYGMLHSYSTMLATERSMWVPFSSYEDDEP